jgi:hypothetical protein
VSSETESNAAKWGRRYITNFVMPGLVPGIHVLRYTSKKDVDGRDKPGHDEMRSVPSRMEIHFDVSTPASFITFAHFAISASIKPRKCSGVSPISSAP